MPRGYLLTGYLEQFQCLNLVFRGSNFMYILCTCLRMGRWIIGIHQVWIGACSYSRDKYNKLIIYYATCLHVVMDNYITVTMYLPTYMYFITYAEATDHVSSAATALHFGYLWAASVHQSDLFRSHVRVSSNFRCETCCQDAVEYSTHQG